MIKSALLVFQEFSCNMKRCFLTIFKAFPVMKADCRQGFLYDGVGLVWRHGRI